jgi:polyisoprenoid-binding protein YceI
MKCNAYIASALVAGSLAAASAGAAPVAYEMDPNHTYPSFEADHMGVSVWRGKFNRTSGSVVLDREKGEGTVQVSVDLTSVDFGHDEMNAQAMGADFFDVAKYPTATYQGKLAGFVDGKPTRVEGELNLHGVTLPVELEIRAFNCKPHPMLKRELCGADAYGAFDREHFGLTAGKPYGFGMNVALRIQVEAVSVE